MNYTTPKIVVLASASSAIQSQTGKEAGLIDSAQQPNFVTNAAYEADE